MDLIKAQDYILHRLSTELSPKLVYHCVRHTVDVKRFAEVLAIAERVNGEDLILIQTAALFHDSGFLVQYDKNEPFGCEIARDYLPNANYFEQQIEKICGMIMATQVPQKPTNLLQEIICDADMDYLGTPDFDYWGSQLREELVTQSKEFTEKEWLELEIGFLESHHYFTATSKLLRESEEQRHLEGLREKVKQFRDLQELS